MCYGVWPAQGTNFTPSGLTEDSALYFDEKGSNIFVAIFTSYILCILLTTTA